MRQRVDGDARSSSTGVTGMASIIVPSFNGARFLGYTLDSLAAQSYRNFEVLVVDDGSTDDSASIARAHPLAPTVIEQRNFGVAVARNRGLASSNGEWVAFLDQDDLWHRDRLSTLIALADQTGASAVATTESRFALEEDRARLFELGDGRDSWPTLWIAAGQETELVGKRIDEATSTVSEITLERLLEGASMLTTSVMYRRQLAISAGGCAPHARALDDHVLNENVARISGPIPRIDSGQLLYRVHPSSTSTVSPMVVPFLSTQAAIRLGGVFPRAVGGGPNVDHLLFGLAKSDLPAMDQLALLVLSTTPKTRARWLLRWTTRRLGIR